MKVALIFPPYTHKKFSENLKVVDEEFCIAPPINLAYVAGIIKNAGHEVILIDSHVLRLSKEKTLQLADDFKPDAIVGAASILPCFIASHLSYHYPFFSSITPLLTQVIFLKSYPRQ